MRTFRFFALGATLAAAALVASCGGGSSGSGSAVIQPAVLDPLTPQGVVDLAAASFGFADGGGGGDAGGSSGAGGGAGDGSPIRKAVVIVTDATGKSVSGLTDDNGNYFVKFSNYTSPIVAKVVDAGGNVLTSVTEDAAVAGKAVRLNINPLTDKIVSDVVVSGTVPGTDKTFDGSKVNLAKLAQAKKDLIASVTPALSAAGVTSTAFDPVKSVYVYDGTGVDAVIESISHTRDAGTGATLLRAKLVNVDSGTSIITASNPLPASQVATPSSPALTFAKMQNWLNEVNRCSGLTQAQSNLDPVCSASDAQLVHPNYMSQGLDFAEDFRTFYSAGGGNYFGYIQGTTFRNPVLLYTGKYPGSTASYDDLALVELTIRQPSIGPSGPDGTAGQTISPVEYVQNIFFKRDDTLTKSKAGNWIPYGNQRTFNTNVRARYHRFTPVNTATSANSSGNLPAIVRSSLEFTIFTNRYDIASRAYVSANLRAVRVTGTGLPAAGVVYTPSSAAGVGGRLAIHNSSGTVSSTTMTTSLSQTDFRLNAVASDGSALATGTWIPGSAGSPGVSGGQTWAIPQVTDFSALQAYNQYKFEIFLNSNPGNTTPDVTEFARINAPLMAPTAALSIPMNDMSPSNAGVTAPQGATSSVVVSWTNNLNAAPIASTYVYAEERSPKGALSGFTLNRFNYNANVYAAYSLNSRPTSNTVTTGVSAPIPSLGSAVAGDYREIGSNAPQGRARVYSTVFWAN